MIEERARPVWEKVISLIGYFDLDPNRALDIIIDVLSQHLAAHYTFFLALLSFSPWRGLYRPPLPENEAMDTKVEILAGAYTGKGLDEVLTIAEESAQSATALPSGGSAGARVLAQVLGFKFSYYQVCAIYITIMIYCIVLISKIRLHRRDQSLLPVVFILRLPSLFVKASSHSKISILM